MKVKAPESENQKAAVVKVPLKKVNLSKVVCFKLNNDGKSGKCLVCGNKYTLKQLIKHKIYKCSYKPLQNPKPMEMEIDKVKKTKSSMQEAKDDTKNEAAQAPGFCNICQKQQPNIQQHFKEIHPGAKLRRPRRTIKIIPTDGNVDPNELVHAGGYCNICEKALKTNLQLHFRSQHMTGPRRLKGKITSIPADGIVELTELASHDGYCKICDLQTTQLRRHFKERHLSKELGGLKTTIPADGFVDHCQLTTGKGTCCICDKTLKNLKRHFIRIHHKKSMQLPRQPIETIPADGDVDPNKLVTQGGYCDMCNRRYSQLKRHFVRCHAKEPGRRKNGTTKIIPASEICDPLDLVAGEGYCEICDKKQRHLFKHYNRRHTADSKPRTIGTTKIIPADGNVQPSDLVKNEGFCHICNKKNSSLSRHFVLVHTSGQPVKCLVCEKQLSSKYCMQPHLLTHSGPVKCSECKKEASSLSAMKVHILRHHRGDNDVTAVLLTPEEADEWKADQEAKARERELKKCYNIISQMRPRLEKYELKLKDPSEVLCQKAQTLHQSLLDHFEVDRDAVLSINAAFISIWNTEWMTPSMVFETVSRRSSQSIRYRCKLFYPDPKLAKPNQPFNVDYAKSGSHRGHLSAAGNYDDKDLVACTYYYSNVAPMYPALNWGAKLDLESYLRELANDHERVTAVHFPLMIGEKVTVGCGVRVPSSFVTVAMWTTSQGRHIRAWRLWNIPHKYDFRQCEIDPFEFFKEASIKFKKSCNDFDPFGKDESDYVDEYNKIGMNM